MPSARTRPSPLALAGLCLLLLGLGLVGASAATTADTGISIASLRTSLDGTQKIGGTTYVSLGQPISLLANITGPGTLSYQWFLNGNPIPKITTAKYAIARYETPGSYYVVVHSDQLGSNTTSASLQLATGYAPRFPSPPKSTAVVNGTNASFTIGITAVPPATFVWQSSADGMTWSNLTNNATYSGVTANVLSIPNATSDLSGFEYRVRATNMFGTAISGLAILVVPPPSLSPALQGKYKITSLTASLPVVGNLTVPLPIAAKAYSVTLNAPGLAAFNRLVLVALLRYAGLTSPPTFTLNQARTTPTHYDGVVSGSATFKAPAPYNVVRITSLVSPIVANLVSPGNITLVCTLNGTITVKGTAHPVSSGTVTVNLAKQ